MTISTRDSRSTGQKRIDAMRNASGSAFAASAPSGRVVTRQPDGSVVSSPAAGGGGSVGAPNSVGGGPGTDCGPDGSPCDSLSVCVFETCVGIGIPNLICGPNSHSESTYCACDTGFHSDGDACVPDIQGGLPVAIQNQCTNTGGTWDATRPAGAECACAAGQLYDNVNGCHGTDPCYNQPEGGVCTGSNGGTGACLGGNCVTGYCIDPMGNAAIVDANGNCVAVDCGPGIGRGSLTNVCTDCGINGFQADGIHCNICPPGSNYTASADSCDCVAGKNWNGDNTACVKGAAPPVGPPPVVKPVGPVVVPCAASDVAITNSQGVQTGCKPPPNTVPPTPTKSGNGLLYGIGAAAVLAALVIASQKKGKGSSKRRSARR